MRLFYLQLRSFYLRLVFLLTVGGTVSRKDQTQFPDGGGGGGTVGREDQTHFPDMGNRKRKKTNRISTVSQKEPNWILTVSRTDQTEFTISNPGQLQAKKPNRK